MSTKLLRHQSSKPRAQAMVEFAIVLPVLVAVLIGIFEVGRLIFIYAAVTNASREAARYGSALGFDSTTNFYHKYRYCDGIKTVAKKSAFFVPLNNVTIQYDYPPSTTILSTCTVSGGEDASVVAISGERVIVTVTYDYAPLTKLMPFPSRTFTSKSARTILGSIALDGSGGTGPGGGGPGGGGGGSPTDTATAGPSPTDGPSPTATDTATATTTGTATQTGVVSTFTPGVTPTITLFPSNTPTPTNTRTPTATSTPTTTPTSTATEVPGCDQITASSLTMQNNSNLITMTVTNPHVDLTVASIQLIWNGATGASGNKPLTWDTVSVGTIVWTVGSSSGNYTSTPGTTVTIPGNNRTTTITITFDKNYQNSITNGTTLTINLSTAGCSPITKTQ